ncbi:hypothetical protein JCM19241_3654 [Vibrio ishigakensis]|uniref:Outer membrane protein beta-barrel domain-containing protein n=1 Tax=Vibrio ishigakensis TaxID=1481914 RepID=A0A0B8QFA5_9VIBR|nr:hypothetical protein JCM19241_3654 [Vibrio ishigakensis]
MNKVKLALIFAGLTLGSANLAHAENFFSGITVGAGYVTGKVANDGYSLVRPDGYSIYSRGYLIKSYKDYLFTDFRVNTESKSVFDLTQYQASLGLGYPFHVSNGITLKPYVQAGWSWNKLEADIPSGTEKGHHKHHDNGVLVGTGLETQFGEHVVANVGVQVSQGDNDLAYGNAIFDVGYKF